jgi:N-acyl-L-homoserine lactone synthetase
MEDVMIRMFHGRECNLYSRDADEMFRLRARQFRDRLRWDVEVKDGWERDRYDDMNPLYLVSKDEQTGHVAGCLRCLPTTGPTMMRDVFDQYFDQPFDIESPLVWECTRFAIEPAIATSRFTPTGLCLTTHELMQGICEVGILAGIEHIVGIFDRHMIRIYRRTGVSPEIIASSDKLPTGTIYVGLWEISEASLRAFRERSGVMESVLEPAPQLAEAVA